MAEEDTTSDDSTDDQTTEDVDTTPWLDPDGGEQIAKGGKPGENAEER